MKPHTLTRGAALAGALTLVQASTALAAASGESTPLNLGGSSGGHAASSGGSGIVRTIVGLFIVIAVIYGVAWVVRQAKGAKQRPSGRGLSQLATLPLGTGRVVALVRAGQELLLLGISEHSVTPIRTYTESEALALGLDVPAEEPANETVAPRPLSTLVDTLRAATVRS
jgi:flagellar protein FliO/FliZ